MFNPINHVSNLNRFKVFISIGAFALLFGCTTTGPSITEAELNSILLVTPADPVVPTSVSTPVPTAALPTPVEAEADDSDSSYPAPDSAESAVIKPAEIENSTENLSYPAPTQVVLAESPVPTLAGIDPASGTAEMTKPDPAVIVPPALLPDGSLDLGWADLVPADFTPDSIYQKYQEEISELAPDDPKIQELKAQMQEEFNNAPPNESLNGKLVRVPGFITPLDFSAETVTEFLLVPYFGACIHVPAPPTNQTVFVSTAVSDGISLEDTYAPIWVTGILQTESKTTDLATAGYTIVDAKVELYSDQE